MCPVDIRPLLVFLVFAIRPNLDGYVGINRLFLVLIHLKVVLAVLLLRRQLVAFLPQFGC